MTRTEAIDLLDNLIGMVDDNHDSDYDTAFKMAIKALEQEPCEDAISRQAVLEMAYDMSEIDGEHFTEPCMVVDVDDIQKLPSVKPQEPKWIPVSERLPEEDTAVLIWCPERRNIYCAYLEEKQWWIFGAYFQKVALEVIAWMPLPKPYEPQESEGKE